MMNQMTHQRPRARVVVLPQTYTTNEDPDTHIPLPDVTQLKLESSNKGGNGTGNNELIVYPDDVAEWNVDDDDIMIIGTQGQKITILGEAFSDPNKTNTKLKSLVLRSHEIRTMSGLESLEKLEALELYDNLIEELDETSLRGCGGGGGTSSLRVLDMSYNSIRDMVPLQYCGTNLQELYLAKNKIKVMTGLKQFTQLQKLDLGHNRIRVLDKDELNGLANLQEFWIAKNKLENLDGIECLTQLRTLDVQENRLTTLTSSSNESGMNGLCYLHHQWNTLEELYLAHNGLDNNGLSSLLALSPKLSSSTNGTGNDYITFPNLTLLDLSRNRLDSIDSLFIDASSEEKRVNNAIDVGVNVDGDWPSLETLWLSGNNITNFDDIRCLKYASDLNLLPKLDTIYVEYNPVSKDYEYRQKISEYIPQLKQLDATYIAGYGHKHGTWSSSVSSSSSLPCSVVTTDSSTGSTPGGTPQKLRQFQDAAIQRAKHQL